jgi:hypothetical protein
MYVCMHVYCVRVRDWRVFVCMCIYCVFARVLGVCLRRISCVSHLRQRIHAIQQHINAHMPPPFSFPSPTLPPYVLCLLQKPAVQPLKTSAFSVVLCVSLYVCMCVCYTCMYHLSLSLSLSLARSRSRSLSRSLSLSRALSFVRRALSLSLSLSRALSLSRSLSCSRVRARWRALSFSVPVDVSGCQTFVHLTCICVCRSVWSGSLRCDGLHVWFCVYACVCVCACMCVLCISVHTVRSNGRNSGA